MLWSEILRTEASITLTQRFLAAGKEKLDSLIEETSFPSIKFELELLT